MVESITVELSPKSIDKIVQLVEAKVMTRLRNHIEENASGQIINLNEFNKKYIKKTPDWIKQNIFYEFNPDWVEDIHPGKGKAFRIHEDEAKQWLKEHRQQIDWNAKLRR
ncbi:DUF771 domain-containing protein [Lactobacillus sp. ESL0681]|uniref:DUF771 domain-containing protein n=1 Tax=Lactobacillus sp. ESL0681 TaxID=2983211 RepID=UPI0023F913C0|nr:DUF771 domain-containing protein [Lactobacillus sp. ESL0681]WEV40328.1 DUF771 domain-containing protein [Lactobacillus sp. ESL0681]